MPDVPISLYEYRVVSIPYVVDGDTADMVIDLGYRTTRQERFRFAGINAPERGNEPGYGNAKTYVQQLQYRVNSNMSALYIRSLVAHDSDKTDSFGRYLATLYEVRGTAAMLDINQGHGEPWPRRPIHGDRMTDPRPGDYGLVATIGGASWWITLGQAIIGDGTRYTHSFIVVNNGMIVEAEPHGARLTQLSRYNGMDVTYSRIDITPAQRRRIVAAANTLIGTPYSFVDYLALALDHWHIRPAWLKRYVASSGRLICSQLVDQAYDTAGVHLFTDGRDPGDVTPGDLTYTLNGPA